ncbi:hypothetical protein UFOVP447_93 [uncultured Caudovirales phage]|uniref:Uncharacterized protein n=1 Tax=uncultured Caudovirales phage TaxID=2100421 RepID=A0A6J5MAJ0_9CAUD|nr:hypothetical protein UFOVP447_93 [uncultured Caudovirales phage]
MADGNLDTVYGKYYTRIRIGPYQRPKPFNRPEFASNLTILLPLPNELRDDTTVSYTNINLETVGDLINGNIGSGVGAALLRNSGNLIGGIGSLVGDAAAAAAGAAFGNPGEAIAGGVAGAIGSLFPAEQITSAIQQATGKAPNPNPSVAFQGPVLRDFSYTWAFYPKSAEESARIDRMIKLLKSRALPKNWVNNSAAILEYPDMCQLNFFPWDTGGTGTWGWSGNSIIRYKKCVMAGVNVNYNPFGTPAFFEGTQLPVTYQLTISFREIEYLLSEDWDNARTSGVLEDNAVDNLTGIINTNAAALGSSSQLADQVTTAAGEIAIGAATE